MRILGVIDLLDGRAVHARRGNRDKYEPVRSVEGDAPDLARFYVDAGVTDLYVADLDAIAGRATDHALVREVSRFGVPLWLDSGVNGVERARACFESGASRVIVGLETLTSFDVLRAICDDAGRERVAFSLDLRESLPIISDNAASSEDAVAMAVRAAATGVGALIVLDLARVGASRGIDFDLVRRVHDAVPQVMVLAGGGIRGAEDLARLEAAGGEGALIATAFHDGSLGRAQILSLTNREHRTSNSRTEPEHEPRTGNRER